MPRVIVIVEGQTEEAFIKNVLAPDLWQHGVYATPILLGVPGHKGGNVNYARVSRDVLIQLKRDRSAYCTTMFDYYGLGAGFPGTPVPGGIPSLDKVRLIESAVREDINARFQSLRFIPYIQLHEYEGLLFSNPGEFARGINQPQLRDRLQMIRDEFETPEDINNDPLTAPSKRVVREYPPYKKVIEGTQAASAVGVRAMRDHCPHFREWFETLQALKPLNP